MYNVGISYYYKLLCTNNMSILSLIVLKHLSKMILIIYFTVTPTRETHTKHPFYCCGKCRYYAYVRCVITDIDLQRKTELRHFSHRHFLFPFGNKRNADIICWAWEKYVQANPAYGCEPYRSYLHKSPPTYREKYSIPFIAILSVSQKAF